MDYNELVKLRKESRIKEERKEFLQLNYVKIHMRMKNILENAKDFNELKDGMALQVAKMGDLAYMPDPFQTKYSDEIFKP